MVDHDDYDDYDDYEGVPCDRCNGDGVIEDGDDCISWEIDCPVCCGDGYISEDHWNKRQKALAERAEWMRTILKDNGQ